MIEPNGCKYCGVGQYGHGSRWSQAAQDDEYVETWNAGWNRIFTSTDGRHKWVQPTQQQIKDRMVIRRSSHEE